MMEEVMLLDLSFLNEEERLKLKEILERDEKIKAENTERLRNLRQNIEVARSRQKVQHLKDPNLQCSLCDREFSNRCRRRTCPSCGYNICRSCLYRTHKSPSEYLCRTCYEIGFLHIQSTSEKEDTVYGSNLIRESLLASFKDTIIDSQPPLKEEKYLSPSSTDSHISIDIPDTKQLLSDLESPHDSGEKHGVPLIEKELQEEPEIQSKLPLPVITRDDSQTSITSSTSLYSAVEVDRRDYEIKGEILVGVVLRKQYLLVHVNQAKDLAGINDNGLSDPYVKAYLLPDKNKKSKRRTKVKKKTINPIYGQTLKYKLKTEDHSLLVIWLSVWNSDKFGRNRFLGEIHLPLSTLNLNVAVDHWIPLKDKQLDHLQPDPPKGSILIGLMYRESQETNGSSDNGDLYVLVKQAKLSTAIPKDAFVTCHLLPNRSKKLKTRIIANSICPLWKEELVLTSIPVDDLTMNSVLELTVWDYNKRHSNDFLGGVRLGPFTPTRSKWMDCLGEEVAHWEAMLGNHGHWVESWHSLRSNMEPQGIDHIAGSNPHQPLTEMIENNETEEREMVIYPDIIESESNYSDNSSENEFGVSKSGSYVGSTISYNRTWNPPKGDYKITGEVLVAFEILNQNLLIHVNKAQGLAAADSNGLSDPYVKTYLLPEKSHKWKRKTSVKYKTLNPVYNETLKYQLSGTKDYSSLTIWLSVWDNDVIGRNRFLGEVYIPLWMFNLREDTHKEWYPLKDHATLQRSASHHQLLLADDGNQETQFVLSDSGSKPSATLPSYVTTVSSAATVTIVRKETEEIQDHENVTEEEEGEDDTKESESVDQVRTKESIEKEMIVELKERLDTMEKHATDEDTTNEDASKLASSRMSIESSWSYSNDMNIYRGNYSINGEILIGLVQKGKVLEVHVKQARGLAAAEGNRSNPYVKTYLLPDLSQKSKRKTAIKKNTLNPTYNQTLKYNLPQGSTSTGLWLSVWHSDRLGRNKFLGEVHFTLSTLDLSSHKEQWYTLMDVEHPPVPELEMGLRVVPYPKDRSLCKLSVRMEQARNIPFNKKQNINVYVKCYLLPENIKRSTKIVSSQFNSPVVWNETFLYERLDCKKLKEKVLSVSVCTRGGNKELIGRFQIGQLAKSLSTEAQSETEYNWVDVFEKPGEWITGWYTLKNIL